MSGDLDITFLNAESLEGQKERWMSHGLVWFRSDGASSRLTVNGIDKCNGQLC